MLRAAAGLRGVAAVEVRAIANEIGEEDRSRWDLAAAFHGALERAIPLVLDAVIDAAATAHGS